MLDKATGKPVLDPLTGRTKMKRKQKWITFHGSREDARDRLHGLLGAKDQAALPNKMTVGQWLPEWLGAHIKPVMTEGTYISYKGIIENHLIPKLGHIRLQDLRPTHLEVYHRTAGLAAATTRVHYAVLSGALKIAARDGLVRMNVASIAVKPPAPNTTEKSRGSLTPEEARRLMATAKASSTQDAALMAVALDSGARRGELQGLQWSDIDFKTGALKIERQLLWVKKSALVFGPTKSKKSRTVEVSAETLKLLQEHKRVQAELKMANRLHYVDHGLIFGQAWDSPHAHCAKLGSPLLGKTLEVILARLVKATGIRRITMHELRHTSATLLLAAGVQPHVVQRRLGHSKISVTLDIYADVLPSQQTDAAAKLAALLHG
jgi:integrase